MRPRHLAGIALAVPTAFGLAALLLTEAVVTSAPEGPAGYYLRNSIADSGAINVVTTVLLDYRAFDTLGEASVILASVAAISALLAGSKPERTEQGLSPLVQTSIGYLAAVFWIFPVYIVFHGHLSPGGGFQGGVSLAVLVILVYVVFGSTRASQHLTPSLLHGAESASALGFLLLGTVGIAQGFAFLTNAAAGFPTGEPGRLVSGGVIPLLNLAIGIKVAAGLGSIYLDILSADDTP